MEIKRLWGIFNHVKSQSEWKADAAGDKGVLSPAVLTSAACSMEMFGV